MRHACLQLEEPGLFPTVQHSCCGMPFIAADDCPCLQSFLTKSEAAFRQHPVWASAPPAHQAQAVEVRAAAQPQICSVTDIRSR